MVINKKACKYRSVLFYGLQFLNVFVSSIISSHVTTEWSIVLTRYLPFLQLHIAGFQI